MLQQTMHMHGAHAACTLQRWSSALTSAAPESAARPHAQTACRGNDASGPLHGAGIRSGMPAASSFWHLLAIFSSMVALCFESPNGILGDDASPRRGSRDVFCEVSPQPFGNRLSGQKV
mmetsp:Transcript_21019/g.43644  ORF Transcript_21019/g.43644 Transcript_21019/m.43644 type:complete len:119 (+) Transcript_21019:168-524(+)